MTSLTFHGGISIIGGNCVIVEESNTRIMVDNGMCFSSEGAYYKNFDEEGELEEKVLMNWISKFSLQFEREKYHASGHAPGIHIREMINKIKPKKIFPIHTEKPELFNYENAETHIIKGQKYFI